MKAILQDFCLRCNVVRVKKKRNKYCSSGCYNSATVGTTRSDATRLKISKALKGKTKVVIHEGQFQKGHTSFMKGMKHSDSARAKMSDSALGKKRPDTSGAHHWNWKGGIKRRDIKDDALRVNFKRNYASRILARDNYTCQVCSVEYGRMHVDHIKRWADFPDLRFDLDNCRTLCVPCHYYVTFKRKMPKESRWGYTNVRERIA